MAEPVPTSTEPGVQPTPTTTSPTAPTPSEAPVATTNTTAAGADVAQQATPAPPEPAQTASTTATTTTQQQQQQQAPAVPTNAPTTAASNTTGPVWPELAASHPLKDLQSKLPKLLKEADYAEVYGVTLSAEEPTPFSTNLILQKFLRANSNDVDKASSQLFSTLKWRKEFQPLKAKDEVFDEERFGGLGYITVLDGVPSADGKGHSKEVVTWNIYGAVKDHKATFGDLNGFLRWRVALMERSIAQLNLSSATTSIPDHGAGADPYTIMQIHDYLSVKFLRMDPNIKAASKKTIEIFQAHYPETLSRKFFVNVPVVMGWVFGAVKLVLAKETVRKFTVLSYGEYLVNELGSNVPKAYGGKGPELKELGETVKLEPTKQAATAPEPPSSTTAAASGKETAAGDEATAATTTTDAAAAAPGAPSVPAPTGTSSS
ncbi:CRAL/TRIO domain-containing protein [Xylona heveae TC161]|uniref:Phosphatidylinositol transfer protein SFH5 n=1 Tax=Xylona heveae (strain CBS 132557 / TC161) TaxID=1328760 RepID=A0A165FNN7_XYLHT|nr:CRAL/TRIO domain-containing protein [Xylona heveae TC161]KZF21195.1 CRAL/TRIO domain-containing protein [Xylona heveae TC161]